MTDDFMAITKDLREIVAEIVALAIRFEKVSGRKLEVTGEIGEILVADRFGLQLRYDPRTKGFDAQDDAHMRVEIKARRSESRERPTDRSLTSRFSSHRFDYALLAILSRDYRILEVLRADYEKLGPYLKTRKRRQVPIRFFRKFGEVIFSTD